MRDSLGRERAIMRTTVLLCALSAMLAFAVPVCAQQTDSVGSVIQFRLARQTPANGFVLTKLAAADTSFYVDEHVLISDSDIEAAQAVHILNGLLVTIRMTPAAAARLSQQITTHIGGRLAVFLNGRFVEAAVIVEPLSSADRQFDIAAGRLPDPLEKQISDAVTARWRHGQ